MLEIPTLPASIDVLLRATLVVVSAVVAIVVLRHAVRAAVRGLLERQAREGEGRGAPPPEVERRVNTIGRLVVRISGVAIAVIAGLMILELFSIDVGPAVAGLGVVGLAVGFGAQTLIRDWFAGIFIVLENQYSEGDVVRIAGVEGVVEAFGLRRTTLRDLDGTIHSVPNGQITVASNLTRLWMPAELAIELPSPGDRSRAAALIGRTTETMRSDPVWSAKLLDGPSVQRDGPRADGRLSVVVEVRSADRRAVLDELRARVQAALDRAGIAGRAEDPHTVEPGAERAEPASPPADPTEPVGPTR